MPKTVCQSVAWFKRYRTPKSVTVGRSVAQLEKNSHIQRKLARPSASLVTTLRSCPSLPSRPVARRVRRMHLHPLRVPLHPLALRLAPYIHMYFGAKLCCTASPRLLIFSSLDGTTSLRMKLYCTAVHRLLIFSSLDGSSCVRLKLCCTAVPQATYFFLRRWR